jgi:hypothetical protein
MHPRSGLKTIVASNRSGPVAKVNVRTNVTVSRPKESV